MDETGWVIECGTEPQYWTGRGPDTWSRKHEDAIRFARRDDAEIVRSWIVKPGGPYARAVQHGWV